MRAVEFRYEPQLRANYWDSLDFISGTIFAILGDGAVSMGSAI